MLSYLLSLDPIRCVQGYHLEFESESCQPMLPSQVNFSEGQREAINKEVLKLLEKEAIVKAQHCPGEFISDLFLVPNKTGDLRPVINLKPLSKFFVKDILKWKLSVLLVN